MEPTLLPHDLVLVGAPAGDFLLTAIVEFEAVDGCTHVRAITRHGSAEDAATHAEMGFEAGWGAALDHLVALFA